MYKRTVAVEQELGIRGPKPHRITDQASSLIAPATWESPRFLEDRDQIETILFETAQNAHPPITDVISHIADYGKSLCSSLVLLTTQISREPGNPGPAGSRSCLAAASVEMLFAGVRHHATIENHSAECRRDQVMSDNLRWNNGLAILGGDHLLARSTEIASELGQWHAQLIAQTLRSVCDSHIAETESLFRTDRTVQHYFDSVGGNTSALFSAACALGAREGEADIDEISLFAEFGSKLGVTFQIVDDVLNLIGNRAKLGPVGVDLIKGVYTLPILYGFSRGVSLPEMIDCEGPVYKIKETGLDSLVSCGAVSDAIGVATESWADALSYIDHYLDRPQPAGRALVSLGETILESAMSAEGRL